MKRVWINAALGVAIVVTALSLVYTRHESRVLFRDYAELLHVRDQLTVEWGRLQLEQATWAESGRIESIARDNLEMKSPESDKTVVIAQ